MTDPVELLRTANPVPDCSRPPIEALWARLDLDGELAGDAADRHQESRRADRRRPVRRWAGGGRRLAGAIPLVASALVVAVVVGRLLSVHAGPGHTSSGPAFGGPGLVVPATYGRTACQNAANACDANARVPAALHRPLRLARLRPGQRCPATPGMKFSNAYFGGVAFGRGPVRLLVANKVDLRDRTVELGGTPVRGWQAIQTLWFSLPSYHGPFVVRAERLDPAGRDSDRRRGQSSA